MNHILFKNNFILYENFLLKDYCSGKSFDAKEEVIV